MNAWCARENKSAPVDDDFSSVYDTLLKADGIILGSPVFFSSATPEIKALIDRTGYLAMLRGDHLRERLGVLWLSDAERKSQLRLRRTCFLLSLPWHGGSGFLLLECWLRQRTRRGARRRGRDEYSTSIRKKYVLGDQKDPIKDITQAVRK